MATKPEMLAELRRLRARVPQLTGSLVASVDGLVLAEDTGTVEAEGTAALTAAALGVALRLAKATDSGHFRELVLRGDGGYVATYAAGPAAVLTVLAEPRANVGRLHLEARRSGARIAELAGSPTPPRRPTSDTSDTAEGTEIDVADVRAPEARSPLPRRHVTAASTSDTSAGNAPGTTPTKGS